MNTLPRRKLLSGALACGVFAELLTRATPAQADLFGGDVAVLLAILTQSISDGHEPHQPGASRPPTRSG